MDNEIEHIRLLIDGFMEGETTLEEERQLAQFFRIHSVPDDWKPLKLMFEYFDQGMPIKSSSFSSDHEKKPRFTLWRWWYSAAAAVIIAIVASIWLLVSPRHSSGDSTPVFTERNEVKQPAVESDAIPLNPDSISTVVVQHNIAQSQKRPASKKRVIVNTRRQDSIEVAQQQGQMEQAQQEILADRIIMEKERRSLREEQLENRVRQSQMRDEMLYQNSHNLQPQPTLVIFQ